MDGTEGQRGFTNPNSAFVNSKGYWVFYLLLIAVVRGFLYLLHGFIPSEVAWTMVNLTHAIVMFIAFHWVKGTPFDFEQGEHDKLTLWEQIDDGVQFTGARKFFIAVPIVVFLISCHYAHYSSGLFALNAIAMVVTIIPKTPFFHRRRLFGINED
eukprot:c2432_g1_i1.p1 GENE.c2432_g1_i1~~c2432_g1_i1.p1  ORF type:complete len:155 (-),score=32.56 c2432_g1_i1:125-589(-)